MADYTDVQNELVAMAAAAIYPNGTSSAPASGYPTYVYAGWPNAQQLNSDLAALSATPPTGGRIHVSVFATNVERDVSRYFPWQTSNSAPRTTLVITRQGPSITIAGTVSVPQSVVVNVAGTIHIYTVQANDTLATIAANVAAMIPGATVSNNIISSALLATLIPGSAGIANSVVTVSVFARAGGYGTVLTEYGRVARTFRTTIWAHTPAARAATAIAIDQAFRQAPFIPLADGTQGRMKYRSSNQDDIAQRDGVYRRDLDYEVEFALTVATTAPSVTSVGLQVSANKTPLSTVYQ